MSKIKSLLESMGSGTWKGVDLLAGKNSDAFKQYLRDVGIRFEPSSNGKFTHFEVLVTDPDKEEAINDYLESLPTSEGYEELDEGKKSVEDIVSGLAKSADETVKAWGFDGLDDADVVVKAEEADDAYKVYVLADFDYDTMYDLVNPMNKVLSDYGYGESYFDAEDSGRWVAYIWKENMK